MEKRTFEQLQEIDNIVGRLYQKDPKAKDSRFGYWYTKFYKKNYQPITQEIAEKIADIRLDNCLTDEKTKEILYSEDKQSYKISKEGMKKVNELTRALQKDYETRDFEVTPQISSEVPEGLEPEDLELLRGLVLKI